MQVEVNCCHPESRSVVSNLQPSKVDDAEAEAQDPNDWGAGTAKCPHCFYDSSLKTLPLSFGGDRTNKNSLLSERFFWFLQLHEVTAKYSFRPHYHSSQGPCR